jgi:tetratricopeptide (TPR) repeat protein
MKFKVTRISLLVILLLGIVHAGFEIFVSKLQQATSAEAAVFSGELAEYRGEDPRPLASEIAKNARQLARVAPFDPEALSVSSSVEILVAPSLGTGETSGTDGICRALDLATRASWLSPLNTSYLLSRTSSNTAATKAGLQCANTESSSEALAKIKLAKELSPFNTRELFQVGVEYLDYGQKNEALKLFKMLQELDPNITDAQRNFFYQLVTSADDLAAAVPEKVPGVVDWVNYFHRERQADYEKWKSVMVSKVDLAVSDLDQKLVSGKIPYPLFSANIKQISNLAIVRAGDSLRRRIDRILAKVFEVENENIWATFLKERSELARLEVLKSVINDEFPNYTMLYGWKDDLSGDKVGYDKVGRVLGLFIPKEKSAKFIILQSDDMVVADAGLTPQIFLSDDNINFQLRRADFAINNILVEGRRKIIISFNQPVSGYIKLLYSGSSQEERFSNDLFSLVEAYG